MLPAHGRPHTVLGAVCAIDAEIRKTIVFRIMDNEA
jgi:hypothetical protein